MLFQGKILLNDSFMVTIDNEMYQVSQEHPAYNKLFAAFKEDDADEFLRVLNTHNSLADYVQSTDDVEVRVEGDRVYYNGVELNNAVVETIRTMMYNGIDFDYMVKFLSRAIQTGSQRVVNELFRFLQACGLTITPDGCFLAYKTVGSDYMDKYSNSIDNSVGSLIPRLLKIQVDDDCHNLCSYGYHVGAFGYAGPGGTYNSPGDHVIICKVAPEDVVSVPTDFNGQKLRCCWYEVVGEFKQPLKNTVYTGKDYSEPMEPELNEYPIDPEDMVVDGMYRGYYHSNTSSSRWRYFVVTEVGLDHVIVELMRPEEDECELRRMNFNRFDDIYEWDGIETVDEDDDDDADDEDTDCGCNCDYCNRDADREYW